MNKRKSRKAAQESAIKHSQKLIEWLPNALIEDEQTARKVACIIWYDKISNYIFSEPYILDVVRSTHFNTVFNVDKVVECLVLEFGYKQDFAKWRMGGRSSK